MGSGKFFCTWLSNICTRIGLSMLLVVLAACSGGGSSGGDGLLRVSLTDAPGCGYANVWVTVVDVRVHRSLSADDAAAGWVSIGPGAPLRLDLLALRNGVLHELGVESLPAGRYQQIRLVLADNAQAGTPVANAITLEADPQTEIALSTPSAQQTGLKLPANIEVPAGGEADVVLDFDACRSVVKRGNSGEYNLKPVVAVIPLVSAGGITGEIALPSENEAAQSIRVSAQLGGVVVKETVIDQGQRFNLFPVPNGSYDVVFTASGRATHVIGEVPVLTGVSTPLGTVPLDLETTSGIAPASGTLAPNTADPITVRALRHATADKEVEVASGIFVPAQGWVLQLPTAPLQYAAPSFGALPFTAPDMSFSAYSPTPPSQEPSYRFIASATGFSDAASGSVVVGGDPDAAYNFTLLQ